MGYTLQKTSWHILDTGTAHAEENMRLDAELLAHLDEKGAPILHFYDWEGESATHGYFTDPKKFLRDEQVVKKKLHLARRSTGGGIVFHIWDLAFSVLVPSGSPCFSTNTLQNYAFVNDAVLEAVASWTREKGGLKLIAEDEISLDASCKSFCMARPTKYDVMLCGKKIAGAAQRQTKKGFLHQGTIALTMPDFEYLEEILIEGGGIIEGMKRFTYPLLGEQAPSSDIKEAKGALKQGLITQFMRH